MREELSPKIPCGLGWEELRTKQRSANDRNRLQPPRRLLGLAAACNLPCDLRSSACMGSHLYLVRARPFSLEPVST